MKKLITLALSVLMLLALLAGCGGAGSSAPGSTPAPASTPAADGSASTAAPEGNFDISKEVELVMYVLGAEPNDWGTMMSEFNKMLKEELNCTLKVNWIGWSDFSNQYSLVLSSGENIDLIYAATWLNFYQQAQKGAFMPLEDLLPVYAPKSWEQTSEGARYQATVGGHVYCLPNGRNTYSGIGAIVRGDLMEKYGIEEFHDMDGYAEYMQAIAENEAGMQPSGLYSSENMFDDAQLMHDGMYPLTGNSGSPYWIDVKSENPQVFSVADWDRLPEYLTKMNEYYQAGYWPSSVLSNQDDKMFETGKAASHLHNVDNWAAEYQKSPDWDVKWMLLSGDVNVLSSVQDAMAIPISAKNPERALMFIEKMRTEQKYWDLFAYGVPGVHSEIKEDGTVEPLDPNNFNLDACSWGMRTDELFRETYGMPEQYFEYKNYLKDNVVENKFRSFFIDTDPIKNEYAAVQNVLQQYYEPLMLGYTDPVAGLEELKQQLEAAGNAKVVEELQKQLDAFIQSYG